MADEINPAGYHNLRTHIEADWDHVAILDDTGTEVTRVQISTDDRAEWTHDLGTRDAPTDQTLVAEITLRADDSDIEPDTPVTLEASASYEASDETGEALGDKTFHGVGLDDPANTDGVDQVLIRHRVEVPEVTT